MNIGRHSFLGRMTIGMSGQAFSRVISAGYTIVLVPLLIRAWGVDGYGQWIALTALTSYMGLSNFGLVTTSANDMVIASGAGDTARASRTFQVSINLTIYVVLPLILLLVAAFSLIPVSRDLNLTQINASAAMAIIACCGGTLWFQTLRGLMVAALYATGSYGFAYYVQGAMKLCELLGIGLVVTVFAGSQVSAAIVIAGAALVELLLIAVYARRAAPWARIDLRAFDRSWISSQAKPAIGFMVSNLSTAGLMIQGPRVVLGALLGGQAVALYAIYTTAIRFVDQLLLTVVLPLEVEIAHSAGRQNWRQIQRLIVLGTHVSWALFLLVALGLLLFGPTVFHIWTAGRIDFKYGLMALFIVMSAANLQGRVSLHALISTNRLYGPSFLMLVSAALAICLGTVLTTVLGIVGMVLGGIAGEIANSLIVIVAVAHWLGRPLSSVVGDLMDFKSSFGELQARAVAALYRLRPGT
jgi:O-antigen/teichoic acid export membrane protein